VPFLVKDWFGGVRRCPAAVPGFGAGGPRRRRAPETMRRRYRDIGI